MDRVLPRLDLRFHDRQGGSSQDERKASPAVAGGENGAPSGPKTTCQLLEQRRRNQRHVAGQKQLGFRLARDERGVDATQRTTARHGVATDDPHGPARGFGGGADMAEQGSSAQAQARLVLAHALAATPGQDADGDALCAPNRIRRAAFFAHGIGLARGSDEGKVRIAPQAGTAYLSAASRSPTP